MTLIQDIMKPRKEILEDKFQGVIQSNKVDSNEPRLENNAKGLLEVTYVSSALKVVLDRVNHKFTRTSNQGAFLLIGPYGTGKTHGLVTLYHLLKEPQIAKK
jgi:predicted AAA+ superfamily ATPase